MAKANVQFVHPELARVLMQYYLLRDCIEGELAIKGMNSSYAPAAIITNGTSPGAGFGGSSSGYISSINLARAKRYLPQPNPDDKTKENEERYRAYVQRAVFYNATARTVDGMAGQVFQRDPVVELPESLNALIKNADGSGVSLTQLAMRAVRQTLPYGRSGIFVDYPPTKDVTTQAQLDAGDIRPTMCVYDPWDIINWQTTTRGALEILSLVVLREYANRSKDQFEYTAVEQYRVLQLDPVSGEYSQEIYTLGEGRSKQYSSQGKTAVLDFEGKPMKFIPFMFIGSENNDYCVDKPPMFDMASLNVAHYRNSADYEETCYICGQPTIALSGLTQEWVEQVLKGTVAFGARAAVPLPVGARADILQAEANTLPGEAMDKKERQMVALGAKLVQQQMVQRSATESIMETSSETSILANVAKNVSSAFTWALGIAATFVGKPVTDGTIKFELNTQFQLAQLTADDQSKLIATWQKGAISFSEMRSVLKKAGVATLSDEEALATIAKEQAILTPTGLVADPFDSTAPPANPNPSNDPAGHAINPPTRGQGA